MAVLVHGVISCGRLRNSRGGWSVLLGQQQKVGTSAELMKRAAVFTLLPAVRAVVGGMCCCYCRCRCGRGRRWKLWRWGGGVAYSYSFLT